MAASGKSGTSRSKSGKTPPTRPAEPSSLAAEGDTIGHIGATKPSRPLTAKQAVFVLEYLRDGNATRAAIAAGYSEKNAAQLGWQLLQIPLVAAEIARLQALRADRIGASTDKVLELWWAQANADPTEISELRRGSCRYCHGAGHLYQRTPQERRIAEGAYLEAKRLSARSPYADGVPDQFDELGGVGFNPNKAPHPDCPECFGDGEERPFFKDTRNASPAAKRLFAGVKATREGLEIKLHDPAAALVNVAKHLGMFVDQVADVSKRYKDPEKRRARVLELARKGVELKRKAEAEGTG